MGRNKRKPGEVGVLLRPSSYCSCSRSVSQEMSCWSKEYRLYFESQWTRKKVDQYPKELSSLSQNSGLFYTKRGGEKRIYSSLMCSQFKYIQRKNKPTRSIYFYPSVQFSSVTQLYPTLCNPTDFPVHHQLPELSKLMSIALVMPSNHLILCHPLLLLPSISTSGFFPMSQFFT